MSPKKNEDRSSSNQEDLLLAILEELQEINSNLTDLKMLAKKFIEDFPEILFQTTKFDFDHSSATTIDVKKTTSSQKNSNVNPQTPFTSMDILRMRPGTLKTFKVVQKLGEATCTQVAEITGRTHGLESRYLNELARHGLLTKKRVSDGKRHYVVYSIAENFSNPRE